MSILYNFFISLYAFLTKIASLFNKKAKQRTIGLKYQAKISNTHFPKKTIWYHCASLGEFEQGRPLIEKIKILKPETYIIVSFFSPSGYEIMKNYPKADFVCYLPFDTKKNAAKFIEEIKPDIAIFVKYEFWHHFIKTLRKKEIPLYLISGIFRENQIFFKCYGKFYRKILKNFTHFFVQNQKSKELLAKIKIQNVTVAGDTRFDRVAEIAQNKKNTDKIKEFKAACFLLVAGSSWSEDEKIIAEFINKYPSENIKYVFAPHNIDKNHISAIMKLFPEKVLLYSEIEKADLRNFKVLIIDNIGFLSSLYSVADTAYIGGGFGAGIHNTPEAAVYGIPVIFGSKYHKFNEAVELIEKKAAFCINNYSEFEKILLKLSSDNNFRKETGAKASEYVKQNLGAVEKILQNIEI